MLIKRVYSRKQLNDHIIIHISTRLIVVVNFLEIRLKEIY
jgi:hypothetical protein